MRMIRLISQLVFAFSLAVSPIWVSGEEPSTAALEVLDRFMTAFNAQDSEAWALTLHYPHVRFASQTVKVYNDPASFASALRFPRLIETGWHHSAWTKRTVTLSSPTKVHIETEFERFNDRNESIGRYQSLYIVTKLNQRWGIQARSSLAP